MKHEQYLYLLEEAHFIREQELAAKADGDIFVPSEAFTSLGQVKAKARIVQPSNDRPTLLVLLIRAPTSELADSTAKIFFEKQFSKAGVSDEGDHVYVSSHVPERLISR
jgi:hypothetical protein